MGSNMAENHPVGFQWVIEARERGARVIHVDPRFTRTSAMCTDYVRIRAGSDIAFLGGIVNHILEHGREFREYVVERDLPYPPDPWKQVEMTLRPVVAISGVVRSEREVEVVSVARVEAMGSPPGEATKLTAELVDGDGRVVAAGMVMRLRMHGDCGCADDHDAPAYPYAFEAYVPGPLVGLMIT